MTEGAAAPRNKRVYQPPELIQYGDIVTLTTGVPSPQGASHRHSNPPGKSLGPGDDIASFPVALANSPFFGG